MYICIYVLAPCCFKYHRTIHNIAHSSIDVPGTNHQILFPVTNSHTLSTYQPIYISVSVSLSVSLSLFLFLSPSCRAQFPLSDYQISVILLFLPENTQCFSFLPLPSHSFGLRPSLLSVYYYIYIYILYYDFSQCYIKNLISIYVLNKILKQLFQNFKCKMYCIFSLLLSY